MQQLAAMNLNNTLRFGLALCLFLMGTAVQAIEEPTYTVVKQYDAFEVRAYDPYVVAEVAVPGPEADAGSQGFGCWRTIFLVAM